VRFRALYFDLDGTLLDRDGRVPDETASALRRYRACGGRFGLATGRTRRQVAEVLATVDPDLPLVLNNGAVVWNRGSGETAVVAALSPSAVSSGIRAARKLPRVHAVLLHSSEVSLIDRNDEVSRRYVASANAADAAYCDGLECPRRSAETAVKLQVLVPPEDAEGARAVLQTAVGTEARVVITDIRSASVEVVALGVNKLTGITKAVTGTGLAAEDLIVFGDGDNDTEMLNGIPVGVAMRHCSPRSCAAALLMVANDDARVLAQVIERVAVDPRCSK